MSEKPTAESAGTVTSKGIGPSALPCSVFLVVGSTGQYSDHMEWNVAAYPTEDQANAHRDAAQVVADSHKEHARNHRSGLKNPHDPQYSIDYTGTSYRVEMVEVFAAFMPTANMKRYNVRFWYNTDLRCDWTGDAYDDRAALQLALAHHRLNEWAVEPCFRVEVSRA